MTFGFTRCKQSEVTRVAVPKLVKRRFLVHFILRGRLKSLASNEEKAENLT
jgi:hypothetical protein